MRRFAATMVGHAIRRLEHAKWWLEESPSREQVEVWQRTVFDPIRDWYPTNQVDPSISRANAEQVARYFPRFREALSDFNNHPGATERTRLEYAVRQLNIDLANAYGLPAVHIDR